MSDPVAERLLYEISHDLLARQVFARFSVEEKALRKAERMLYNSFELHQDLSEKDEGTRLLNREELIFLKPYIPQLSPEENILAYVQLSEDSVLAKEEEEKRKLQAEIERQKAEQIRQRRWLTAAVTASILMLGISIFAVVASRNASIANSKLARKQDTLETTIKAVTEAKKEADQQTIIAEDNAELANQQALIARQQTVIAEIERENAKSSQKQAEELTEDLQVTLDNLNEEQRIKDSLSNINNLRLAEIAQAQDREYNRMLDAIVHLKYDEAFQIASGAMKFGLVEKKIQIAMMELAYYYRETKVENKYNQLINRIKVINTKEAELLDEENQGDLRSLFGQNSTHTTSLEELAGDSLMSVWEARYFPEMQSVEGGNFWMGESSENIYTQLHEVQVESFKMSKYEISVFQYELYTRRKQKDIENLNMPDWGWKGNNPMVSISWYDAVNYCNWLSGVKGYQPVYFISTRDVGIIKDANGFRLPTEAEWEYAAGGGKKGRNDKGYLLFIYAGGNDLDHLGVYRANSLGKSGLRQVAKIGSKSPNVLGLYDMSGNVWEWCADKYGVYDLNPQVNPIGTGNTKSRVVRSGSWKYGPELTRVVHRHKFEAGSSYSDLGFRVVRNVKP